MNKLALSVVLSSMTLCASSLAISAPNFIDLDAKFGINLSAISINDRGQISGATTHGSKQEIILISGNDIDTLSTDMIVRTPTTSLNNNGEVIATMSQPDDISLNRSNVAKWDGAVWNSLGPLNEINSFARGINDNGFVVGLTSRDLGSGSRLLGSAVWDSDGNITHLNSLPGGLRNEAYAINDNGVIVGWSQDNTGPGKNPVIWDLNGNVTNLPELPNSIDSVPVDINESNQATGYVISASNISSVLWDGNSVINIGSLAGMTTFASSINDHGQIVGTSGFSVDDDGNAITHAFIWDAQNGMVDLNDYLPTNFVNDGWILTRARDINNHGSILSVAFNTYTNESTTFLISSISPIPEPATYAMLLAGLGMIGFMGRRKIKDND